MKRKKKIQGVEGEDNEEILGIDLGVLEVQEDLPPVTQNASGLSFTPQEVIASGGSVS